LLHLLERHAESLRLKARVLTLPDGDNKSRSKLTTMARDNDIRSAINGHPWDRARRRLLKRRNALSREPQQLDRGVNYFVLQLERMGIRTEWSCEGHPAGFYISFYATYEQALRIKTHGYFTVEIERLDHWSMRFSRPHKSVRDRNFTLRLAAAAWEQAFGPLDQEVS
jgi:hypothetical protein